MVVLVWVVIFGWVWWDLGWVGFGVCVGVVILWVGLVWVLVLGLVVGCVWGLELFWLGVGWVGFGVGWFVFDVLVVGFCIVVGLSVCCCVWGGFCGCFRV